MIYRNLPGLIVVLFVFIFSSCSKKEPPPEETCFDKIKNQNEVEADCGGICKPCPSSMTAKVNGNGWLADTSSITTSYTSGNSAFQLSGRMNSPYSQLLLVYLGEFSTGEHTLNPSSSYTPHFDSLPAPISSGTITISEMDSRNNLISGSFKFTSTNASSTITYSITEGAFSNIKYILN